MFMVTIKWDVNVVKQHEMFNECMYINVSL